MLAKRKIIWGGGEHIDEGLLTLDRPFCNEKKNNVGWREARGQMTLNARGTFFCEKENNVGWGGACGRVARYAG